MRLRGPKIAIISAVVFLLNLQKIVREITLRNPMFLREIMIDDFSWVWKPLISHLPSDDNSAKTRMAHKKKNLGLAKTSELVWYSARIPLAGHPLETELSNGKRKIWGTEPYSSWWCSETRNTNAKACIFGKAHWSVESFHREKLSLRWTALWFRKIYCQSSLSRGRRSFVPKAKTCSFDSLVWLTKFKR